MTGRTLPVDWCYFTASVISRGRFHLARIEYPIGDLDDMTATWAWRTWRWRVFVTSDLERVVAWVDENLPWEAS